MRSTFVQGIAHPSTKPLFDKHARLIAGHEKALQ
jgi:hypothetical protein